MKFKLALGTGVAIVAVYCVLVVGIARKTELYDSYHIHAGIIISTVGAAYLAVKAWKGRRGAPQPEAEDHAATDEADEPASVKEAGGFFNTRYASLMAVILGLATVFLHPLPPTPDTMPVQAAETPRRPIAKAVPTNAPPPVVQPAKPAKFVTFPPVKLQGIYYKPERPSALFNGKTYFVGDIVQDAKVIVITRDYVLLEFQGEQQMYVLEP